jgi:predicted dehydrogenase
MTSKLSVGIVGCGLIGNKRARVVREDPSACICCASDVVVSNAQALVRDLANEEAKVYRDWQDILMKEKLDVVIVSTPNKYLKEITLQAAQRKVHILCEKPLGKNIQEAKDMVTAAKKSGIILKTGFNHRHHPAIFKAKKLAREGTIGALYYAKCSYGHGGRPGYEKEWRASKEVSGGGELLDQGVHVVDLFRWFFGDFQEAFGTIATYYWDINVEDNAFALFKTAKGQTASMHTSWTQWKNRFTFEIFGEAGYLIVEGLGGSYGVETLKIGKRKREQGKMLKYIGGVPDEEILTCEGPDTSWREEWKEFTAAIRENREPMGNGEDGLEANRMIEAVYRSVRENRPVKIRE